jgi:hypothetical protein
MTASHDVQRKTYNDASLGIRYTTSTQRSVLKMPQATYLIVAEEPPCLMRRHKEGYPDKPNVPTFHNQYLHILRFLEANKSCHA